jgi:dienelactone hydrolase
MPAILNAQSTWKKAIVKLISYDGPGHGFVGVDRANTDASKKSKAATLEFFATHL